MGWYVLLPPIVAIALALWTRQVFVSLFAGILLGTTILQGWNPLLGLRELLDQLIAVFGDAGNTRIVFFCLLVGGLIALFQASGGIAGFVNWMSARGWGTTRRSAELLAVIVGIIVFVESSITTLTVGAVSRPFFDKLKIPREKLAYYCDATSAPVCMTIPLNGWGAYILGLIAAQGIVDGSVSLLISGLAFNFFSWLAILFALFLAITGWGFGPMKKAELRAQTTGAVTRPGSTPLVSDEVASLAPVEGSKERASFFLVPLLAMMLMIFVSLWITGDGQIQNGSGSTAVLWAVCFAIGVCYLQYALTKRTDNSRATLSISETTDLLLKGSSALVPVTLLIVFAFALGQISRALEMGPYLVSLVDGAGASWWMPGAIFVVGCFVSFTMGSSWTTFAILIPIALPLAEGLGVSPGMMLGAVLSGGVFGDHCSPLSDTSIISSMASACDHVDHVNSQLPYALLIASAALVMYLVAGAIFV